MARDRSELATGDGAMMKRYPNGRWLVVCVLAAFGVACAGSIKDLQAPRVELIGVSVLPGGGANQRFRANLSVRNPNSEPLPIAELRFSVRLAGEGLLTGQLPAPIVVAAQEEQTLRIDVDSEQLSSLSRLLAVQGQQSTLPYEIVGNVILDRRMRDAFPIAASGQVALSMSAADR
jgi:LEA14-like dessication related protein